MASKQPNKVNRTTSGRFSVQFRHEGRSTSRTFATEREAEAFAMDGAAFGWDRALTLANTRTEASAPRLANQPTVVSLARVIAASKPTVNTRENYEGRAALIALHPIADMPVGAVTSGHVAAFLDWLAVQPKRVGTGTYSSRTVQSVYTYLVQVFRNARKHGWVTVNPMEQVDEPEVKDAKPHRALSPYEVEAIFAQAPNENAEAYFRFMLATGARPSEAAACTWDGIEPADHPDRLDVFIPGTKTSNAARWVTVPRNAIPALAVDAWAPHLFNPRTRYSEVFRDMVSRAQMVGYASAAGFEPLAYVEKDEALANPRLPIRPTPHTLRHTHATRLFHSGQVAESVIIGRLGHSDADYSRENYVDMGEIEARHQAGRIIADLFPELDRPTTAGRRADLDED